MSSKRRTAKKTEPKAPVEPKPMDPTVAESPVPVSTGPRARPAYALRTLISEIEDIAPEIPYELSNYKGFNTALDVSFDLTAVPEVEVPTLVTLLGLVDSDPRVARVEVEDGQGLVSLHANSRTQDLRDPFGLREAYDVLSVRETEVNTEVKPDPEADNTPEGDQDPE